MIVVPVKTDKDDGVVASLFGKAKFFSTINDKGEISTHTNVLSNGIQVAQWFKSIGVKSAILSHLGETPFQALLKNGIEVYFAGNERISLNDVLQKFRDGSLPKVTKENFGRLLGEGEHHHEEGEHDHGGGCCSH